MERVDHVVEGRAFGTMEPHQEPWVQKQHIQLMLPATSQPLASLPLSSASSGQSLSNYSEHSFNENLYVNGQVPRGQFKEYFAAPTEQT